MTETWKDQAAWADYRRNNITEMRPYVKGENLAGVSISDEDAANGSPREGDMIARNPDNHRDMWLVAAEYFVKNYRGA